MLNRKNLHAYQIKAYNHIIDNPKCGLFLDMGLGKTVSTLTAVEELLFDYVDISSVLVVAPKRVVESVWTAEIKNWEHLTHLKTSRIIGNEKQRLAALKTKAHIYLVSRDNIAWLCGQYGGSTLPFDMLVVDESSSFKNPKSQRFKALRKVAFDRVVILTGTPAPNGLIDLWSQVYLLDRGERLGKFIGHYRSDFFTPNQRNGHIIYNYKVVPEGEKRIFKKISDICMSMKAKDYLNLPKRIDNIIKVKLSPSVQAQYEEFEKQQVLAFLESLDEDEAIAATNAAALSNKLLQYANGAVYDADKVPHVVHDFKLDALADILEEANGQPVLVAWTYRSDMHRIMDRFKKYKPRQLKKEKDIDDWNAGKIPLMLMHPASGGHGLNLQKGGNIIVWFGQNWSLELYQQFNARLYRQGQTKPTIIHHLVADRTIDLDVIAAIARKDEKQAALMAAIKARISKYEKLRR